MKITYACPRCLAAQQTILDSTSNSLTCLACHTEHLLGASCATGDRVETCFVCGSRELFLRKDFPQRLGVAIVTVGFLLSSIAWYYHLVIWSFAALFATAFLDLLLFLVMGNLIECYRCHAQYRGSPTGELRAEPFDLEIHERYRQQAARTP